MSTTISGVVKDGVVVPDAPLPEGATVEMIVVSPEPSPRPTLAELRRMPREERQKILAAAAKMAEQDYRDDNELTGFAAFSEEAL
jgi:hypothetical protein